MTENCNKRELRGFKGSGFKFSLQHPPGGLTMSGQLNCVRFDLVLVELQLVVGGGERSMTSSIVAVSP